MKKISGSANDYIVYVDFPKTFRKIKGVYCIENVYIGASHSIKERIRSHINEAIHCYNKNYKLTNLQDFIIISILLTEKVHVRYINKDPFMEHFEYLKNKTVFNSENIGVFYHNSFKHKLTQNITHEIYHTN